VPRCIGSWVLFAGKCSRTNDGSLTPPVAVFVDGLGVTGDVVELLNDGVPMLFFNGINDLICNHIGNEIAVENFQWKHQGEYQTTTRYGWKAPSTGKLAGYMKEYKNLMYLKVLDSGHMVPMDVPEVGADMMRTFIHGMSFNDYEQELASAEKGGDKCPVCPAARGCDPCPECDMFPPNRDGSTSTMENTSTMEKRMDFFTVPPLKTPALVGIVILGLLLLSCICWLICPCRRRKKRARSEYGMELPSTSSSGGYTDQPEKEGEFL